MTQDEIIDMARQAGLIEPEGVFITWDATQLQLETLVKLVEQHKVNQIANACAKLPFGDTAHSFAVWIREQA